MKNSRVIGPFGEYTTNENLERIMWTTSTIYNGYFKHKNKQKYTWTQSTRNLKSNNGLCYN